MQQGVVETLTAISKNGNKKDILRMSFLERQTGLSNTWLCFAKLEFDMHRTILGLRAMRSASSSAHSYLTAPRVLACFPETKKTSFGCLFLERQTGLEPAVSTLARSRVTNYATVA